MASQRMIKLALVETDKFIELPPKAQLLYFNLILRADDDGFIGSTKMILRLIGADDNDLELLIKKGYIILFDSGVCVISHWLHHNHIKPSIYKETLFTEERELVHLNEKGIYERNDDTIKQTYIINALNYPATGNNCEQAAEERAVLAAKNNCEQAAEERAVLAAKNNCERATEERAVLAAQNNCEQATEERAVLAAQNNCERVSEVSVGKESIDKDSKGKCSAGKGRYGESSEGYTHGNTHTMYSSAENDGTAQSDTVMSFAAEGGCYRMTKEKLNGLIEAYPGLDVMKSLERVRKYLDSHPAKRRSVAATESYIGLWLSDDAEKRTVPLREQSVKGCADNYIGNDDLDDYESTSVIDMLDQMPGFEDIALT